MSLFKPAVLASAASLCLALACASTLAAEAAVAVPAPSGKAVLASTANTATVVLAGGCFWGVQGVFQHTQGVLQAVSGYAGGKADSATYSMVSSGTTGHAEAVQVTYDPRKISYGQILQIYFSVAHDPTQLNRQGPDHGTQYRSAIFTASDEQAQATRAYIAAPVTIEGVLIGVAGAGAAAVTLALALTQASGSSSSVVSSLLPPAAEARTVILIVVAATVAVCTAVSVLTTASALRRSR